MEQTLLLLVIVSDKDRGRATISSGIQKTLVQLFPLCSISSKFNRSMLRVEFFLLSIKTSEESNLYPVLQKGIF